MLSSGTHKRLLENLSEIWKIVDGGPDPLDLNLRLVAYFFSGRDTSVLNLATSKATSPFLLVGLGLVDRS